MTNARELSESAVLIAGGSSGVGLASALALVDAGVRRLALASRSVERGEAARAAVATRAPGVQVDFFATDADDPRAVEDTVARAHETMGRIDVLVSSIASAYRPELLFRTPMDDIAGILTAQALPPMYFTRAVLPFMRADGGGSIMNIASDAAKTATPGESVLGAAMAAIVMFTRTVAIEGKRDGIRANALTPSLIANTPTAERVLSDGFSKNLFEKAAQQAHLGVAEPEDLASLVVFLASPAAAKLTGQAISVNGGISAA
jgi:NAD(P)-dependent dehydrogenase (short-subunit alcohol dehydrogenase family)